MRTPSAARDPRCLWPNLRPGDWVWFNGTRRLLVDLGRRVVTFYKIGHSWTDPNPRATYDVYAVKRAGGLRLARHGGIASRARARWANGWTKHA